VNNKEIFNKNGIIIWSANPKDSKDLYLGIFNTTDSDTAISVRLSELNLTDKKYTVRDLWAKKDLLEITNTIKCEINLHGTKLFKLSNKN
jgi:hypothetical protein